MAASNAAWLARRGTADLDGSPTRSRLLQIVPRRTAAPDGVGDYARRLASLLADRHGLETTFVCGTAAGIDPAPDDPWPTVHVERRTASALVAALTVAAGGGSAVDVLVHVGGYGYARRGAPLWLLEGLRRWRASATGGRLVGVFHELYASGQPWQSSFWFGGLQKHVARGLWQLCDAGVTTNSRYLHDLQAWRADGADIVELIPVPSNVGEPDTVLPLGDRPARAAVFGRPGMEIDLYCRYHDDVARVLAAFGVEDVIDIGERASAPPQRLGAATVVPLGRLPAERVSAELSQCRLGLLAYDLDRLGKSTIFAAYAAHGIVPVCFAPAGSAADGLAVGRHVLDGSADVPGHVDVEEMQRALVSWYRGHTSMHLAGRIAAMCRPERTRETVGVTSRVTVNAGRARPEEP